MTMRVWWWMLAGALVLPAAGCDSGKSCVQICNEISECPDVDPIDTSCEDQCTLRDKIVQAGECQELQADYDACLTKTEDICTAQDCNTEALAAFACIDDYCTANPSECQ